MKSMWTAKNSKKYDFPGNNIKTKKEQLKAENAKKLRIAEP